MDRKTANSRTYKLLSDILKIAGEYQPQEIKNVLNHVSLTSKGDYHEIMTTLLKNFELLNNLPEVLSCQPDKASDKSSQKGDGSESSGKAKPAPGKTKPATGKAKPAPKDDPKNKELRAMLEDNDFIKAKKDVVKIIGNYFKNTVTLRSDNKDSKRDLIAKVIRAHKNMEGAEKEKAYSALRRFYLKSRK